MRKWRWCIGVLLLIGLIGAYPLARQCRPMGNPEASPTLSVMLVALGGARGIITEILWWRINDLQQQSRSAEIYPLTEWLTLLEPDSPDALIFNSWNCSYNLSGFFHQPEERWRWVKRGEALLQQGLRLHPQNLTLLKEMRSFWLLKFFADIDPAQAYYRQHVADIPITEANRAYLRDLHLTVDENTAEARLLYWAHRAQSPEDMLYALAQMHVNQLQNPAFNTLFSTLYLQLSQTDTLTPDARAYYKSIARARLHYFPNDPALHAIVKESL